MTNPRQRRKARSSSHGSVSHSKRAKKILKKTPPIRGPKILQDSWDKTKTVRQNYAALGLVHTLNPIASGGHETTLDTQDHEMQPVASLSSAAASIPQGYGKIIRDSSGNVLRIELDDDQGCDPDQNDQLELRDPQPDKGVISKWVTDLGGSKSSAPDVTKKFEHFCVLTVISSTRTSRPRYTSDQEMKYLMRLISKYGADNVEGMAKDGQLNPDQKTAGELGRAIRKAGLL